MKPEHSQSVRGLYSSEKTQLSHFPKYQVYEYTADIFIYIENHLDTS